MVKWRHCLAANPKKLWKGVNWVPSHSKTVDSVVYSYGPLPERMSATARKARSPILKNSASSPPGAGRVWNGS